METATHVREQAVTQGAMGWRGLADLYLRPSRFFTADLPLGEKRYLYGVLLVLGVVAAQRRIDGNIVRSELGSPRPGWENLEPVLMESWLGFWAFSLASALLSAVIIWYLGGWWYGLRVRWSGAAERDKRQARVIFAWVGMVAALPSLVYMVISTAVYPDYAAAWASDEMFSLLLMVFPFWGVAVSYKAVRAQFPVKAWPALFWFVLLPVLTYVAAFGGIGAAYAVLQG